MSKAKSRKKKERAAREGASAEAEAVVAEETAAYSLLAHQEGTVTVIGIEIERPARTADMMATLQARATGWRTERRETRCSVPGCAAHSDGRLVPMMIADKLPPEGFAGVTTPHILLLPSCGRTGHVFLTACIAAANITAHFFGRSAALQPAIARELDVASAHKSPWSSSSLPSSPPSPDRIASLYVGLDRLLAVPVDAPFDYAEVDGACEFMARSAGRYRELAHEAAAATDTRLSREQRAAFILDSLDARELATLAFGTEAQKRMLRLYCRLNPAVQEAVTRLSMELTRAAEHKAAAQHAKAPSIGDIMFAPASPPAPAPQSLRESKTAGANSDADTKTADAVPAIFAFDIRVYTKMGPRSVLRGKCTGLEHMGKIVAEHKIAAGTHKCFLAGCNRPCVSMSGTIMRRVDAETSRVEYIVDRYPCCGLQTHGERIHEQAQSRLGDSSTCLPVVTSSCCRACERMSVALLVCQRCKSVRYCDADCQKKDWKAHRPHCAAPVPTRAD